MLKYSYWLRKITPIISLIGTLFLVSCSEEPAPGPISPIKPADKLTASKPAPNQSTVRPVIRLENSDRASLAKSGYNRDKVLQELQTVRDEVKAIVDKNAGTTVASYLNEVVKKANDAIYKLTVTSSDEKDDDEEEDDEEEEKADKEALETLKKARAKLQETINKNLLLSAQGSQFINQFLGIEKQINEGYSSSGDCRGRSKSLWIRRYYGGLIKFGGHSIEVPKYATKQDALFSISISATDYITADFGPDGWFDQDVTVTISYKDADLTGIDPAKLTLAWYDESAGQWIDLGGTVDLLKKTVTAKTKHFTQYTISTK